MTLTVEPLTPGNLSSCARLWADGPALTASTLAALLTRVRLLLERRMAIGALVLADGQPRAYGISVFAREREVEALLARRRPQIGTALLLDEAALSGGILDPPAIGRRNASGEGLELVDVELLSDLARFEGRFDPNEDGPDSNPYGIKLSGNRRIVADAGANALLEILDDGDITTLATFPTTGWQAVPTGVAVDRDGNYYVGQLTGFPFPAGQANVYRVPRNGGTPEVFAAGFSNIIDLEFGPDGSLWVLQIGSPITGFANRALIKVSADGQTKTPVDVPLLSAPGGLAVARNGDVYVTNKSVSSTDGELLRIRP